MHSPLRPYTSGTRAFATGGPSPGTTQGLAGTTKVILAEPLSSMLKARPFPFCKLLAQTFRVAKTTCLQILHKNLGLKEFHRRWVPCSLDSTQKRNRVTLSHELLDILPREETYGFEHVISGDESWFFRHYPTESAWAVSQDEHPVRVK
jgi:hypothetical protein